MFEDASEFFKDIGLAVSERLTSPLIGTYWISWTIWNFKFFLIAFSGEQVNSKLMLIHDELFSGPWDYVFAYGAPLLMTGAFIYLYPRPARKVYELRLKFQRELNSIKQKEEDEELLSEAESRRLRLDIREKEREFNKRLDEAEKEISDLRRENESLRTRGQKPSTIKVDTVVNQTNAPDNSNIKKKSKKTDPFRRVGGLSAEEVAIMKTLSNFIPSSVNEGTIILNVSQNFSAAGRSANKPKIRQALQSLVNRKLVDSDRQNADANYFLSKAGEEFCRKYDL